MQPIPIVRGRLARHALLLAIACSFAGSLSAVDTQRFYLERQQVRKERQQLLQGASADRIERGKKAAALIGELIDLAEHQRLAEQDAPLRQLLAGLRRLAPDLQPPLETRFTALPAPAGAPDPAAQRAWSRALTDKRQQLLKRTRFLIQAAVDQGVSDLAYGFVREYLAFHPDDPSLRAGMGETQFRGAWYGHRDLELAKMGLEWDRTLGWIIAAERARYAKGDYFDLQAKVWTTLEAADGVHASLTSQWSVMTEHLEIRGNAQLKDLVDAANRLEAFYEQIFAAYAQFFTPAGKKSGGKSDIRLVLGMLDHPRLVVNIFRTEKDYKASVPNAGWSAGMFIPASGASFFYVGYDEAVYHEFTHQILHMFTGGNQGPAWLTEGIAVYTQAPTYDDGELELGHFDHNHHILGHFAAHLAGNEMKLDQLMAIVDGRVWMGASNPNAQYCAAGAFVQFCMEGDERRYRADFVDFLRDSYQGGVGERSVWNYFGVEEPALKASYEKWVDETAKTVQPRMQRVPKKAKPADH
jgi:hypothetical protein